MAISKRLIRQAIESFSEIDGVLMDPANLVEDAFFLAFAFPHDNDYLAACASTRRALERLAAREVDASSLKYEFEGWESYYYQHRVGQDVKATCRIMYRRTSSGIKVKGFGHRRIPADFYERMAAAARRARQRPAR